jgi:YD repeat-containing protein
MMPAAKHFDIVLGVDVHLVVTPPAPPLPIPHPFIGMVFDPSDFIPMLGATVWVNGFPRAQAGTSGKNSPAHIPLGAKFVMPSIANEGEVYMGSATVLVEEEPFSYMALPVLSCNDVGMPTPLRPKKKAKKSLFLPTSVVLPIPIGQAVLVGGPPTISLSALAFKAGMGVAKGLGKGIKGLAAKVRKYQQNSQAWKKLSNKIHDLAEKAFKRLPENVRNRVHRAICAVTGHPVDIATGKVFTEHVDFELPGPLPLRWERVWYSVSGYQGPLGHGWHHLYDLHVREEAATGTLVLRTADGRNAVFPALEPGADATIRQERLTLRRDAQGYVLHGADRLAYRFGPAERGDPRLHLLRSIADPAGHRISFDYNPQGHLALITDSAGRQLPVQCDAVGRILAIRAPHPDRPGETFPLVGYAYDGTGNLAEVRDALDQPFRYRYAGHLLVQETNRNGLSFYFEYDGTDTHARCLRTWGDGGIYDHKLTYFPGAGYTVVENSLGHRSVYHYNEDGLVYRTVGPLGHETHTGYDDACRVVRETDERGQTTFYAYDERGNRTALTKPDGSTLALEYDDHNQLAGLTNETGARWQWTLRRSGQPLSPGGPAGPRDRVPVRRRATGPKYDALGGTTALGYDATRQR